MRLTSSLSRRAAGMVLLLAALALLLTSTMDAPPALARDADPAPALRTTPTPDPATLRARLFAAQAATDAEAIVTAPMGGTPCTNGTAGIFSCENVDLLSILPLTLIGGGSGSDSWGWTDPQTGKEYAIVGRSNGTAFVDIADPVNPVYLGNLPTADGTASWRDIKVYEDHAFIVADGTANANHGMQIFDLTQLRNVTNPPVTFTETAHYGDDPQTGFGRAHNLVMNEATGYAYVVGARSGPNQCGSGLHIVNVQSPTAPTFAGCFSADGYTHDAQCVVYTGPDTTHQGREICFNANEDTLTIVDVENKLAPVQLAREGYAGSGYTHQGWLTPDHRYFLLDDELDELNNAHNTYTYIWDVQDLDNPVLISTYVGPTTAIDHNLYVHDGHAYEANYRSGLRILDVSDVASGTLTEVGYFDTYPPNNFPGFEGAWNVYPFFESGVVIVSDINSGLFILQPTLGGGPTPTATSVPPTATSVPPTSTSVPPTATSVPPTTTSVPPTTTSVPPTATSVPPTSTSVPPTATSVPPTSTSVPPTATSVPSTPTVTPGPPPDVFLPLVLK